MKLLQQSLLFLFTVAAVSGGAVIGLGGASAVADYIYGTGVLSVPVSHLPLGTLVVTEVLILVGMVAGAVGVLATVVLPLHFALPSLSRHFWRGTISDRGLYRWYLRRLNDLASPAG